MSDPDGKSAAAAHARIAAHEDLCAERYERINDSITDMKSWLKTITLISITVLISMLGFLLSMLITKIH